MAVFVIWHGAGHSCKEKSGWLNWLGAECHGGRYCLSHSAHSEQTSFSFCQCDVDFVDICQMSLHGVIS